MQSGRHAARLPARTGTELTHLARTDTRHRARQLRMKTRCPHPPCLRPTWRSTPPPPLFQACGACSRHRRCVLFVFVFPTSPAHKYTYLFMYSTIVRTTTTIKPIKEHNRPKNTSIPIVFPTVLLLPPSYSPLLHRPSCFIASGWQFHARTGLKASLNSKP